MKIFRGLSQKQRAAPRRMTRRPAFRLVRNDGRNSGKIFQRPVNSTMALVRFGHVDYFRIALLVLTVNSLAKEPYPAGVPEECVLSLTAAQTSQMLKGRNSP